MGRVKDYILQAPPTYWRGLTPLPLITRDAGGRWHSWYLLLLAIRKIRHAWRDGSLALVHVNMGDRMSLLRKGIIVCVCQRLGVPVFLHLHAVELDKLPRWALWALAAVFRRATAVIVLGEAYRVWIEQRLGITRTPIRNLWNGVPIAAGNARCRAQAPPEPPLRIVFLGTLGERKGVADLITALAQLPHGAPQWRAILAGPGDALMYQAQAAAAGIGDKVEFPGWLDQHEAQSLLADGDMMVLPSYDEGLPLVVLEALGLGVPVITTPVGVVPEALTHGRDVILVKPGDIGALAQNIGHLLKDPRSRRDMSQNGLEKFRSTFSIDSFSNNLANIWHEFI